MFMQTRTAFDAAQTIDLGSLFTPATQEDTGLVAGTMVEAAEGWRPVESLSRGDAVFTLDGGLRAVVDVRRADVTPSRTLSVPGGALGNCADLTLLPGQHMLLETDQADEMFETPHVLVPAAALAGYRGITWTRQRVPVEQVIVMFEEDEIVYGNTGTLFHCPALGQAKDAPTSTFFTVLGMEQARAMIALMQADAVDPFTLRHAA